MNSCFSWTISLPNAINKAIFWKSLSSISIVLCENRNYIVLSSTQERLYCVDNSPLKITDVDFSSLLGNQHDLSFFLFEKQNIQVNHHWEWKTTLYSILEQHHFQIFSSSIILFFLNIFIELESDIVGKKVLKLQLNPNRYFGQENILKNIHSLYYQRFYTGRFVRCCSW